MEKFAVISSLTTEKWDTIISAFKKMKSEGVDINSFRPGEEYNNLPIGNYIEELRQLRGAGKLTENEVDTLSDYIKNEYFKYRWMYMYKRAKEYFLVHGDLQVKISEDRELFYWVADQRKKYRGADRSRPNGVVDTYTQHTEEQRRLLEEIDIDWDVTSFNKYYPLFVKFRKRFPDKEIQYPCWFEGRELYRWVVYIQSGRGKVTEEQKELLLKQNFDFKKKGKERYNNGTSFPEQAVFFYFRQVFKDAENRIKVEGFELDMYSEEHRTAIEYDGYMWHKKKGDIHKDNMKDVLCKEKGIKLIRIREEGLPKTDSAINYFVSTSYELLDQPLRDIFKDELGVPEISIDIKRDCIEIQDYYLNLESVAINRRISELVDYVREHHSFPPSNKKHTGLYGIVLRLRELKKGRGGRLTDKQIAILDNIGMIWNPNEYNWEVGYSHAKEYFNNANNLNINYYYVSPDGYKLGNWIYNQRCRKSSEKDYRGKLLTEEQIKRLDEIGMIW